MRRFYVSSLPALGVELELDDAVLKHLRVLRLQAGESILLFDGSGRLVEAVLVGERARLTREHAVADDTPFVGLLLAIPKGSKADDVVRMTTELGVAEIHLVLTERTVGEPKPKRIDRLRRIAAEAARQSERVRFPVIHAPCSLSTAVAALPADASKTVCWARAKTRADLGPVPRYVAVGPEGGFTDAELTMLDDAGFQRTSIAPHVLRVDTAAVVAVAWAVNG